MAREETELFFKGRSVRRVKAGEATVHDMPMTFRFRAVYEPGTVEAVSYSGGREVSRAVLATAGEPRAIRLASETDALRADGLSLAYVHAEIVDADGRVVPDARVMLTAGAEGQGTLAGFGSGNPVTDENYTSGRFTSDRGRALAIIRAGYEAGSVTLRVRSEGLPPAEITLPVKKS